MPLPGWVAAGGSLAGNDISNSLGCADSTPIATDHEWDALISAWAAMKGDTQAWSTDLRALSTHALDPAGRVAYWWPEDLRSSGLITKSAKQAISERGVSNTSSKGKTTSAGYVNKHDQEVLLNTGRPGNHLALAHDRADRPICAAALWNMIGLRRMDTSARGARSPPSPPAVVPPLAPAQRSGRSVKARRSSFLRRIETPKPSSLGSGFP